SGHRVGPLQSRTAS
ncbi:hypothetical protein PC128_g7646, partial [Phytophthora cactorum]